MRVLIADDDAMTRLALRGYMVKWGYDVVEVEDGLKAWEVLSAEFPPEIAILDWMMPGIDGIEICRRIKMNEDFDFSYIILLTSKSNKDDIVFALDNGAHDFLSKPVHSGELRSRVAVGARLMKAKEKMRQYANEMERLAITDALTGIYNRHYFFEIAQKECERSRRYNRNLTFMIIDIDHFKKINDTYGHFAGDQILREMSALCEETLRESDLFARYGGEEFIIMLPETDLEASSMIADRLSRKIRESKIKYATHTIRYTISVGIASFHPGDETVDAVLRKADTALYKAKDEGRDQVVLFR